MTGRWSISMHDGVSLPAHDCQSAYSFEDFVNDTRVPFIYRPAVRVWGIPIIENERFPDGWWNDAELHECTYCPWCGEPFPPPLHNELRQTLAALGLEPGDSEVPPKFKTDIWWRELGL